MLCFFAFQFMSCKDDETVSIEGSWEGDRYEIKGFASGIPVAIYEETEEDFDIQLEFEADGSVSVTYQGDEAQGVWEWVEVNKKISITADFGIEFLSSTEVFEVKKLSSTELTFFLEKEFTFEDPESEEEVEGTVKATLYFNR